MSSSQSQMVSVKEVPKKVSAKEKFEAAKAAKMAKKAEEEKATAAEAAARTTEKAKHDVVFAKEKKKIAKDLASTATYEAECRAVFSEMTREQKMTRLGELQAQLDVTYGDIRKQRMELNCSLELSPKEAKDLSNLEIAIHILKRLI